VRVWKVGESVLMLEILKMREPFTRYKWDAKAPQIGRWRTNDSKYTPKSFLNMALSLQFAQFSIMFTLKKSSERA
jgi:hypothetical protein